MSDVKVIDFLGKAKLAITFSVLLLAFCFYQWFSLGDKKYGIDFLGGHEIVVQIKGQVDSNNVREALKSAGFEEASVQAFESSNNQYSIRLGGADQDSTKVRTDIVKSLESKFTDGVEVLAADFIGPVVGKELQRSGLIAITIGLIGMLIYITFRFEFAFALGAVVALFHDVVAAVGVYLFLGYTLNMATIAAVLTIVGYSVNDTLVIFDRVREELVKHKNWSLQEIINYSLTVTLSRTIITSLLTFFSALALYLFGGGAIADLSLCLLVGIISGSYSTIFIASPVALAWERFRRPVRNNEAS
jgi:preprotein translocase subunit SecF